MPYTCSSCGRYQQGQSADGICPASTCQPARLAKAELSKKPYAPPTLTSFLWHARSALVASVDAAVALGRELEREAVVKWLREMPVNGPAYVIADCIERGDHAKGGT